jgi:hypothetical protein
MSRLLLPLLFSCDHLIDMLKGYRIAGKIENKQKGLKSLIYLVLRVHTGGCSNSILVPKAQ